MKRSQRISIILTLLALTICACSLFDRDQVLYVEDAGSTVELKQGEQLTVVLVSNPSTGYSWEWVKAENEAGILVQIGEKEYTSDSDLPGAGGEEVFQFKAMNIGQTRLLLVYHRPWEKGVELNETFEVRVVVK